jgi:RNA polymerase sigma-70 factor (ECF subfamily)
MEGAGMTQDDFTCAAAEFGPALARLARAYEADADQRRDLVQDMNLALWRSFAHFAGQCSLRTWVFRVYHNTAITTKVRRRRKAQLVSLEDLAETAAPDDPENAAGNAHALARLEMLIRRLAPPDNQVMLLYLEDIDAASIGDITGLSARAVAARIHRIKALLARQFRQGDAQ